MKGSTHSKQQNTNIRICRIWIRENASQIWRHVSRLVATIPEVNLHLLIFQRPIAVFDAEYPPHTIQILLQQRLRPSLDYIPRFTSPHLLRQVVDVATLNLLIHAGVGLRAAPTAEVRAGVAPCPAIPQRLFTVHQSAQPGLTVSTR